MSHVVIVSVEGDVAILGEGNSLEDVFKSVDPERLPKKLSRINIQELCQLENRAVRTASLSYNPMVLPNSVDPLQRILETWGRIPRRVCSHQEAI